IHSRPVPSALPSAGDPPSRSAAMACLRAPRSACSAPRGDSTSTRHQSQPPTPACPLPSGSAGLVPLFTGILGVWTHDPSLRTLPANLQPLHTVADRLVGDLPVGNALRQANAGSAVQGPNAAGKVEISRLLVQDGS